MTALHAIVFFIFLQSQPVAPGQAGMLQTWVLYGCPSEQLAGQWTQAQFVRDHLPASVGIKELRVLPMRDLIYTETGPIPAPWAALPRPSEWQTFTDAHHTFYIAQPNKHPNLGVNHSPAEQRAVLQKSMADDADLNWDVSKSWYYVVYTKHEAMLIKEVNAPSVAIVYTPLARGTAAGEEIATVLPWHGLTTYQWPLPNYK